MQCYLLQKTSGCLYSLNDDYLVDLKSGSLYLLKSIDLVAMNTLLSWDNAAIHRHVYTFVTFLVFVNANAFLQVY